MSYDKATMRLFEKHFRIFDRLTALGCKQRKVEYDRQKCQNAWLAYGQLFIDRGMEPPPLPFL